MRARTGRGKSSVLWDLPSRIQAALLSESPDARYRFPVLVDQCSTRPERSRRQRDSTSRPPIRERCTKNAASCLGPVCMLSTKLVVPSAGDAHVHHCGVADNKSRFLSTRTLCVPLAQWRLAPAAKFGLHWSAKASLEEDESGHLSHRNNRT